MAEFKSQPVRYLFADIAEFTKDRPVEAQADLVKCLNIAVKEALGKCDLQESQIILLPTGDGICIAITDESLPYDIHLRLAIALLSSVRCHNDNNTDPSREYHLRIGLNQNVDILLTDINMRPNVAGSGINIAQRVMSQADPDQVMVGQAAYEVLHVREAYFASFRKYNTSSKHGLAFSAYQFVGEFEGLNSSIPSAFAPKERRLPKLTKHAAYYIACAYKEKDFLHSLRSRTAFEYPAVVWLYLRAQDFLGRANNPSHKIYTPKGRKSNESSEEQFSFYDQQDFWVTCELAEFIGSIVLKDYAECFDDEDKIFVSSRGLERLQQEMPEIFAAICELPA
jgi:class 3 adenylate cyclase